MVLSSQKGLFSYLKYRSSRPCSALPCRASSRSKLKNLVFATVFSIAVEKSHLSSHHLCAILQIKKEVETMAKYTGVTQNNDGSWTYRIKIKLPDGKVVDTRIKKDERGNPFLTARAAHEARKAHEASIRANPEDYTAQPQEVTLADVYDNYMTTEAKSKAPATLANKTVCGKTM